MTYLKEAADELAGEILDTAFSELKASGITVPLSVKRKVMDRVGQMIEEAKFTPGPTANGNGKEVLS